MVALLVGCGDDDPPASPGRFGEVTSAVVLVNPVINQGSTTSVVPGGERSNVEFQVKDLPVAKTDSTGLAGALPPWRPGSGGGARREHCSGRIV